MTDANPRKHMYSFNSDGMTGFGWFHRTPSEQLAIHLGKLDGTERWAYCLFALGEGESQWEASASRSEYMQSTGTRDAMNVEVRRIEPDGMERQYVIGRPGADYSVEPSVRIPIGAGPYALDVYPHEVFTAEEATILYYAYFLTGGVPSPYVLRPLPGLDSPVEAS